MKFSWEKIKRGSRGLGIILFAAILLELISGIQYYYSRREIEDEARKLAREKLENANLLVESAMSQVEVATMNVRQFVLRNLSDPMMMFDITRNIMEANPILNESAILFVPDYYKDSKVKIPKDFQPVTFRNGDGSLSTFDYSESDMDFYTRQWYFEVVETGAPVWTDPYISYTDGELICTYSVPVVDTSGVLAGVLISDLSLTWLENFVKEGAGSFENSFSVILNKLGGTILDTRDGDVPEELKEIGAEIATTRAGEMKLDYRDTASYAFYGPLGKSGWSMAIICPEDGILGDINKVSAWLLGLSLLGLALLVLIMYLTGRNIVKYEAIKESKQKIESELNIAHGIQMGMVPNVFPSFPERDDMEIFALLNAAKEVGGDLYDYFIADGKFWFCVGDVSGKGVPASLVMAVTRSLFRSESLHGTDPEEVMRSMNSAMVDINRSDMFVTMLIGRLDLADGTLDFCNAGHNAPIMIGHDGPEKIKVNPNLPLGLIKDFGYRGQRVTLPMGATVFLYTDGLTEAENPANELFGEGRLLGHIHPGDSPADIVKGLSSAVSEFAGGAPQSDDITMLAILYRGGIKSHLSIRNEVKELEALPVFVDGLGLPPELVPNVNLALEEAVTNSVMYAYEAPGTGDVDILSTVRDGVLRLTVCDSGKPFDPTKAKDPDLTLPGKDRPVGGLGIFLVRKLMDDVSYVRAGGKNILRMTKKL